MIFNTIDLNLLRVFSAVSKFRSVTAAAESLGLSQPAATKQLNRLRELLEDPLFTRTTDGMAPTPRAEALAMPIHRALLEMKEAYDSQLEFLPKDSTRTFRIFMNDVGQMALLPKVIAYVAQQAPHVNIETVQVPASRMRTINLESGDVDLAVGYFEEFDDAMHCQVLFEERYAGMVRAGHPQVLDKLSLEQFLELPQLIYHPAGGGHGSQESFVDKAFMAAGATRRVAVRIAHAVGISSMVSLTDLLVIVPGYLAHACAELVDVSILDLPLEIPSYRIGQYWHDRYHHDPASRWLRGIFFQLYGSRQTQTFT
jgi:DNA-binding transcriptional LysR family regulator